jgi:hypothetical protein
MEAVDLNPLALPGAEHAVKHIVESAGKAMSSYFVKTGQKAIDKSKVAFLFGFKDFLLTSYEKCRCVKTIISPDVPIPTDSLYTNVDLQCGKKSVSDDQLIADLEKYKYVVVQGSAGSGKSWLVKRLILRRFDLPNGKIPLMIELRQLNRLKTPNLMAFLVGSGSSKNTVSDDQFRLALAGCGKTLPQIGCDLIL